MSNSVFQQIKLHKESWKNSFCSGLAVDKNNKYLPWMVYEATEYLLKKIDHNSRIFEFGSGASTIFLLNQQPKTLVSVETDPLWKIFISSLIAKEFNTANKALEGDVSANFISNFDYRLVKINHNSEESKIRYSQIPANNNNKFDIIIIDSCCRYQCFTMAMKSLAEDGVIILDDSQRGGYKKIFSLAESCGFDFRVFKGIAPGGLRIKETTFFIKK
jgi:predicted O-methyltransferase YrrM